MTFCAFSGSFQRSFVSARAFSSARRLTETSQSKMPPQEPDRLLDGLGGGDDVGTHGALPFGVDEKEGAP
jgi:hypothetical protein